MIARVGPVVVLDTQAAELIAEELERTAAGIVPSDAARQQMRELAFELAYQYDTPNETQDFRHVDTQPARSRWDLGYALTPAQAADRLGVSAAAVRDLAHRGRIPARKVGGRWRIDAAAVTERVQAVELPERAKLTDWV